MIVQPKNESTIASDYEPYRAGMSVFKQLHPGTTFNEPSGAGFNFAQVGPDQQVTINQWLWNSADNPPDAFLEIVLQCPKQEVQTHK